MPGPAPFAVHVLDADANGAPEASATASADGSTEVIEIEREARRFVVLVTRDGSAVAAYDTAATASTHVVLDPPAGERVTVSASEGASEGTCRIELSAASGDDGFASGPLVFTLDDACVAAEETSQPPIVRPDVDGGAGASGGAGTSGGAGSGGAGTSGHAGTSGAGGDAPDAGDDAGANASKPNSGCGCRALRTTEAPLGWPGWLGALVLTSSLCARARRRRRVSVPPARGCPP